MADRMKSFDTEIWAKEFVEMHKTNTGIASDESTMIAWFASALMRGYEEGKYGAA